MGTAPGTKSYVQKRSADGLSKREIVRCLKRYVARDLYPLLRNITVHNLERLLDNKRRIASRAGRL